MQADKDQEMKETPAEDATANEEKGGLLDDDAWGDVEDVSLFSILFNLPSTIAIG